MPNCDDTAEFCTGASSNCPADGTGNACGNGVVESGEQCDDGNVASGDGCQSNCTVQSGYQCTGSPSVCTAEEPGNCGNAIVDSGEDCDGGPCCTESCTFRTSTTTCRAAAGSCDVAESCSGTASTCPTDTLKPSTTVCRPAVSPACDVAESCTGSTGQCPTDVLVGCPDTDGSDCMRPACSPSGQCTTTDDCEEICRPSSFWALHAGSTDAGDSLIDDILQQTGAIDICGQMIDSATDLGVTSSAMEALCVRTSGVFERPLFRQLVTTALNCAVSEGGTCDDILSRFINVSFTQCNSLCASNPTASPGIATTTTPTVTQCINELACFNAGGHHQRLVRSRHVPE